MGAGSTSCRGKAGAMGVCGKLEVFAAAVVPVVYLVQWAVVVLLLDPSLNYLLSNFPYLFTNYTSFPSMYLSSLFIM